MQIKQRIMRGEAKGRYGLQGKNCDSTPHLDKENNINARNEQQQLRTRHEQEKPLELMRSMDLPKRLRTSANDEGGLLSSQELFHFKQRNKLEHRHESATFSEHLTFGEAARRPLMPDQAGLVERAQAERAQVERGALTSRELQQERALKNEVIDELIGKARRQLCRSLNEPGEGSCANHLGKKAKYRLVSELGEGEEEMFYCSKCAINLLQQGFPIEEIHHHTRPHHQPQPQARTRQVAVLEGQLQAVEQRARAEADRNDRRDHLDLVQEEIFNCNNQFREVFERLEALRKERLASLTATYASLESEQLARREGLLSMLGSMADLQREIEEYRAANRFSTMRENEFQFLATALANKLAGFEEALVAARAPSPRQRLSLELTSAAGILERLRGSVGAAEGEQGGEWACDEKKPFRILFPAEDGEEKRTLLSSVRECPSFGNYP